MGTMDVKPKTKGPDAARGNPDTSFGRPMRLSTVTVDLEHFG